jgi:hypothetical protein
MPKRRTRDETRDLVIQAALELVKEHGLGVEPTVRVTRASVHERLWESQEAFQVDVLLRVSRMETGLSAAAEVAAKSLKESSGREPLTRMRELARLAPNAVLEIATADPLFYSWVGYTLSLAKDSVTQARTRKSLAERTAAEYAETEVRNADLVKLLSQSIGVRPRSDLFESADAGYRSIARLGLTLAEGATVRMRFDESELPDVVLKTGPDGAEQTWTAFAAGYWALLNTFLEVDPEAQAGDADDDRG